MRKELITNMKQIPKGMSWGEVSKELNLSEAFISRHAHQVDWTFISIYQKLSESFIEAHALGLENK